MTKNDAIENPKKTGWYKVQLKNGTITEMPFVRTFAGKKQWLALNPEDVQFWWNY